MMSYDLCPQCGKDPFQGYDQCQCRQLDRRQTMEKKTLRIEAVLLDEKDKNGVMLLQHDIVNIDPDDLEANITDLKDFLGLGEV